MAHGSRRRSLEARLPLLLASALLGERTAFVRGQLSVAQVRLQNLDNIGEVVNIGEPGVNPVIADGNMLLYAGVRYSLEISQAVPDGLSVGTGAKLRLRLADDDATDCTALLDSRYVKGSFGTTTGAAGKYSDTGGGGFKISVSDELEVRMGGYYKFCFTTDGNFSGEQAAAIPVTMKYKGVYDYVSTGLLEDREYNCYLRKKSYYGYNSQDGKYSTSETSCRVWFGYDSTTKVGYMKPDQNEKGSWSAEFEMGLARKVLKEECGVSTPAPFICKTPDNPASPGACSVGSRLVTPLVVDDRTFRLPTVTNQLSGAEFRARTVAACYCPGYSLCDQTTDFVQQIGILRFFLTKVCDPGVADCPNDYTGVTPQYQFSVIVQCPGDACRTQQSTRMKIVQQSDANDYPSWKSDSGCREAKHGMVQRGSRIQNALKDNSYGSIGPYMPFAPQVTPKTTNPTNCDATLGCPQTFSGIISGPTGDYEQQDFKGFGNQNAGFQFIMGDTDHEARNFYDPYDWDICFCRGTCTEPGNWFKAGAVRLSPTRLLSSATAVSNLAAQWNLEYTNTPGIIGMSISYDDEYTLGLKGNGMLIKIIQDMPVDGVKPRNADDLCWKSGYDSQLVIGPADANAASFNYAGTTVAPESTRIIYNAGFVARTITITKAGRIAVCYCGRTDGSGLCKDGGDLSMNWRLLARMTIKGPKLLPQQYWTFSTNVNFRFSYVGYGLTSYDTVRIIDFSGKCTDDNFNPDRAAYDYTFLKTGCPLNCKPVTRTSGTNTGDLSTRVRASDCSYFNRNNGECVRNDIEKVIVVSDAFTELVFQTPHNMQDGDEISLQANYHCKAVAGNPCTDETVDALRGSYQFADNDEKDFQSPSTYLTPHRVAATGDPLRLRISIGWPTPVPQFEVIFVGTDPNRPDIIGEGGQWTHHSTSFTKEEIVSEQARANMKVCWSFGRPEAPGVVKYVEEVGLLTITDPAIMEGASVSISTLKLGQAAPMIIQFRTASSDQIGAKYDNAVDSIRLKIIFSKPKLLDIHYSGLDAAVIPYSKFVDYEQAAQMVCGQLFLEMWSEDMERGFPLPKGCYYRSFDGANPRREMEMVFEPKSGLRKNTLYQIVFNAHIQGVLDKITSELTEDTFIQLIPMDDVTLRPYEAIERGDVKLDPSGRIPRPDPSEMAPEFHPTSGFKLIGGYNNLLELKSGDALQFELMGGIDEGNKITAGCKLRIFLWPLTQWMTTSSCTAGCMTGGESSFGCEVITCEAEAMVPGMTMNILKLTLGSLDPGWTNFGDLFNNQKARIRIGSITMPSGGFFAQRLAAQITDAGIEGMSDQGDSFPHYKISIGNLIWKAPTLGQTVAKVVGQAGGGNLRAYRQENDNILYARLILSSTLLARDDTGQDASFTITLPPGYTCKQPIADRSANYWEAPDELLAFKGVMPQGRGTPDDLTQNHGWTAIGRNCTFRPFHPYGVVYAGSSLVVRITVDNPDTALQMNAPANFWTFSASSRGLCGLSTCVKQGGDRAYNFLSSPDLIYQSNNVVLGRIVRAAIQPSSFNLKGVRDTAQNLRIFFQTEQEVTGGGQIRVQAPPGFDFGSRSCTASHLEDPYYAATGDPADATLRLPVDPTQAFQCVIALNTDTVTGMRYQEISVLLRDILQGGRYFGFQAMVNNPSSATVYAKDGWRIFTVDSVGFPVDGTPSTVPFIGGYNSSWGVYKNNDAGFKATVKVAVQPATINGATVLDMRPYSMSNQAVYLTLELSNVPAGASGDIRVTLPDTYAWDFSSRPLIFRKAGDPKVQAGYAASAPATITAAFPPCVAANAAATTCPYVLVNERTLTFTSGVFTKTDKYGFAAPMRVPDSDPVTVSDNLFVELGYTADLVVKRTAAAAVPLPEVRALRNAFVDYTTSIKGKETALQFTLETVTDIPQKGFIQIMSPPGFVFSEDCYIMSSSSPDATIEMPDLGCISEQTDSGTRIRLDVPTGSTLRAGRHFFSILAENPRSVVRNALSTATACGTSICWLFQSFRVPVVGDKEELDKGTTARGYSINARMLEGRIPATTSLQTYATGRDDRPSQKNNVIFAFQLSTDITQSGEILLRAPWGFLFDEECGGGIDTKEETIYGLGNRFPDEFQTWPAGVVVTGCRGDGRDAHLPFTVAAGAKLTASSLYIIRVGRFANPLATPDLNQWNLEISAGFYGEASEPIAGMALWTFTSTSLTVVATARDQTLAGESRTKNPLRFLFRPYNNVPQDGELRAQAPDGFTFSHLVSGECDVSLQELPYVELGVQYPGYVWPAEMLVCLAEEGDDSKVSVRVRDTRVMMKGLEYELILYAFNARRTSTKREDWMLQSWLPGARPLDESRIPGFIVNDVMSFQYTNEDPANPGQQVVNGKAVLPNFVMMLQFPDPLTAGDIVVIMVPTEFIFTDYAGSCINFRWVCNQATLRNGQECVGPLQRQPVCNATEQTLSFFITDFPPVPQETLIQFSLSFTNPARTMGQAENLWRCTHYGLPTGTKVDRGSRYREDPPLSDLPIYSSKAFASWAIVPQMVDVSVKLVQPGNMAAGSVSGIQVSFVPVNDAEDVAIVFMKPPNFDFSDAYLVTDPKGPTQEIMADTGGNLARIRMRVIGGVRVKIVLKGVVLGSDGGQTMVSITSWTNGMLMAGGWNPGTKQDERLACATRCSFVLPGSIDISYEKLAALYQENPDLFPIQSRWEAQMARPSKVKFRFALTQPARVGDELWIHGLPYQPTMQEFTLAEAPPIRINAATDDPSSRMIKTSVKDVLDRKLKATLQQGLAALMVYEVQVSVICPTPQEVTALGKPVKWTLETWAYPYGELPTNSNDGQSREFTIVEQYTFDVLSSRAPPLAEIQIGIYVKPGLQAPTSLVVVAPLGFTFNANCLVAGGGVVQSCSPNTNMPNGQKTALLKVNDPGLQAPTSGVVITVNTPSKPPLDKSWFIEGRDAYTDLQYGWGQAIGIDIEQMAETSVTYPGIPGLETLMVFDFKTQVMIESGGWLQINLPEGFDPVCGANNFVAIALPTTGGCQLWDSQTVIVMLNSTMVAGEYAFAFTVTPPVNMPIRNQITLILKDRLGTVRDAAVDMPGKVIQDKLKIRSTPFKWTQSKALRPSTITIGFEILESLPDLVVSATQQISEILISFPVGFVHLIDTSFDFQATNPDMPFKAGAWFDFMQRDRLRIYLDLNRSSWTVLKTGRYEFVFRVLVPSPLPVFNAWFVSLCSPNYPEGCNQITDPAVLVTFVTPGFQLGQIYGSAGGMTSGSSGMRPLGKVGAAAWSFVALISALCLLVRDVR